MGMSGMMGTAGEKEVSQAPSRDLVPQRHPCLSLTGHGPFGLCGQVDDSLSLGSPSCPIPRLHRVSVWLGFSQILNEQHAVLGVVYQHLLHRSNGSWRGTVLQGDHQGSAWSQIHHWILEMDATEHTAAKVSIPAKSLKPCVRGVRKQLTSFFQKDSLLSGRASFRCKVNMPQPLLTG